MQDDSADSRGDRERKVGIPGDREGQRGQLTSGGSAFRDHEYSHPHSVQEWGASKENGRSAAEEESAQGDRTSSRLGALGLDVPIRRGENSLRVRDLRLRLSRQGLSCGDDSVFDVALEEALVAFQSQRGLSETGVCDTTTWLALVEAGFDIGDRVLYLKEPYFRGDDIAWLQTRLGGLGFDCGRVDGIFAERTHEAVVEFQVNMALAPTGICGSQTIEELQRVSVHSVEHIHSVRERELLRNRHKPMESTLVVVASTLLLEGEAELIAGRIRSKGARSVSFSAADQGRISWTVNQASADFAVYLDNASPDLQVAYYSGYNYVSPVGRELAEEVVTGLREVQMPGHISLRGMTLPVLRESRAPTVTISVASASTWTTFGPQIADGIAGAIAKIVASQ